MTTANSKSRWLTHTALYLALGILLPVGFHMFGIAGRVFLPMHIPVLLAGFLVGPLSGIVVGLLAPPLSYLLTGMPPSYAVLLMMLELAMYGLIAGVTYLRLHWHIMAALLVAIIGGRLMFAAGLFLLGMFVKLPYDVALFFSVGGPLVTSLPGVAIQFFLIPFLVTAVKRRRARP